MKNTLKYFYNIEVKNIRQSENVFFIETNSEMYAFQNCDNYIEQINNIYELNIYLNYNNIYVYGIIKNKFDNIVTRVNENNYILLEINDDYNKNITVNMIYEFQYKIDDNLIKSTFKGLAANDWKSLWMRKIDYFEYQVSEFGLKYPLVRESIGYFIGMAENALCMINNYANYVNYGLNESLYLQHRRIDVSSRYYDFYNPLNLIFDTRVRDFCEYYKSNFMYNSMYKEKIKITNYLGKANYTINELKLLYIRMFFPSYYFDLYEKVVSKVVDEKKLKKILLKVDDYQLFLYELMSYLNRFLILPHIEWIS